MTEQEATLKQDIEALQELAHSRGWRFLKDRLRKAADHELTRMKAAVVQDALLKHTYTYIALTDLIDSPEALLKALTSTQK